MEGKEVVHKSFTLTWLNRTLTSNFSTPVTYTILVYDSNRVSSTFVFTSWGDRQYIYIYIYKMGFSFQSFSFQNQSFMVNKRKDYPNIRIPRQPTKTGTGRHMTQLKIKAVYYKKNQNYSCLREYHELNHLDHNSNTCYMNVYSFPSYIHYLLPDHRNHS